MSGKITLKTPPEIEIMAEGGKITSRVLEEVLQSAKPGVSTLKLDELAEKLITEAGGRPSFKMVPGYNFATCMNVNEIVVHGIPTHRPLQENDILGVDLGVYYQGFHTDMSWTVCVRSELAREGLDEEIERFLMTGERTLQKALDEVRGGNFIGNISQAIQKNVEGAGFEVVKQLVGHGIGRQLHEAPEIPGWIKRNFKETPPIVPGMVLAIEVIYSRGNPKIVYENDDGWTIATRDKSPAGLFEKTVAATQNGPVVLTNCGQSCQFVQSLIE